MFILLQVNYLMIHNQAILPVIESNTVGIIKKLYSHKKKEELEYEYYLRLTLLQFCRLGEGAMIMAAGFFFDTISTRSQKIIMIICAVIINCIKFAHFKVLSDGNEEALDEFKSMSIQSLILINNWLLYFLSFVIVIRWFDLKEVSIVLPLFLQVDVQNMIFDYFIRSCDQGIYEELEQHGQLGECNQNMI